MEKNEISKASLGRVPIYINYIEALPQDTVHVSATKIAKDVGLGEVQVRKDLSLFCKNGKPKVGYEKEELLRSLKEFLFAQDGNAIVVGAGRLGKALLEYSGFEAYGIHVLTAFDHSVDSELKLPSGKSVLPSSEMTAYCQSHEVHIGIIAAPSDSAQAVLNQLYACGIKRIWCFAQCSLYTPADVIIRYENLALSLAHLKLQSNQ